RLGWDGPEQFVATAEAGGGEAIGGDPLPPGQVWAISPGAADEAAGLYRIDVQAGRGSGVKITNVPAPGPFREGVKYAEHNLVVRSSELVGTRNPDEYEFAVQLRPLDSARSGIHLGIPVLLAFCSAMLQRSLLGGLVAVGGLNLGGEIEPVHDAARLVDLAIDKGATSVLMPVAARRQLNEMSDEAATKITILYYNDAREA